ncbi:MAG: hypothetical protein KAS72_07395 [Phycisphaerales bacterium]|nr:hypothetical protein [Phycisphaerales bacterium]
MKNALTWLLDLDQLSSGGGASFGWERPIALWLVLLIAAVAGTLAVWSYRGLLGRRSWRITLATVRTLLLLLLVSFIAGPQLILREQSVDEDVVLVLLDRSASLQVRDGMGPTAPNRVSRDDELHRMLYEQTDIWYRIQRYHHITWLGFHDGAFELAGPSDVPALQPADGLRTDLASALTHALRRATAQPVSGIIVVSDGKMRTPLPRHIIRQLQTEAIQVHTIALGSDTPIGEFTIDRIEAPKRAFINDLVPVRVVLDCTGDPHTNGTVRIVGAITGEKLAEQRFDATRQGSMEVTLTVKPTTPGIARWTIQVALDADTSPDENNVREIAIEMIDRPLRVLYIEDSPRWEYRYLKNLLIREASIEASVMLLSADRDFTQEGNTPITCLPNTAKEMEAYDVVIIGDIPGGALSEHRQQMIRDSVSQRGTGLIWLAGPDAMPASWRGAPLAALLPIQPPFHLLGIGRAITMQPTDVARRLGVLELRIGDDDAWDVALSDPSLGWTKLWYAQRIDPSAVKPAVEVLAKAGPDDGHPIVLLMRYGAGQTLYIATDEIWRWRYGRGEMLFEQFWLQLIRMLGRSRAERGGAPAILTVDPTPAVSGEPIRIELELIDEALIESGVTGLTAVIHSTNNGSLLREVPLESLPARSVDLPASRFAATIVLNRTGQIHITVPGLATDGPDLEVRIDVKSNDEEVRNSQTDHELLRMLSHETGGSFFHVGDTSIAELPTLLPNRDRRTVHEMTEALWDTPLAFILVMLLLSFEWIARRAIRLT